MRDTKLHSALVQLDGFELNRLHRFILSPYFNRSEAIIHLFEWIKEDLKNPYQPLASKEDVWKICFGEHTLYNDGRFRKLQSDLLRLIEEFYSQEVFETHPIYKSKYLLEAIYAKKLDALQTNAIKSAQEHAKDQTGKSASYYYYQYEIERNIYLLTRNQTERSSKLNIEDIVINLDRFYLAEKLRYYTFIVTHQHFAAVNYKMLFIDEIIDHINTHEYGDVPAILIYYQILLTYKEPDNRSHYELLSELIRKHIHLFSESEAKEIIDSALNYCIIRMNAGEELYVREAFNLYCQSLENKLLLVKGQITPWSYKNIVTAGLRLSEFNWVENFIKEYSPFLDEKFRSNAVTFNLAQLYFYKRDYQKVIEQLSKVEYDDFTYNLNSKTLLMASYYELDEIEALNSLLDAFRIYVQRNNKLTKGKGSHYLNTINIVRKLAKIKHGDTKNIDKLVKEVIEAKGIVSKNWILEKLDALKPD